MKGLHVVRLGTGLCTIKCLALGMCTLSLDMVIELLRCFPCLEKLYIQVMILHSQHHLFGCSVIFCFVHVLTSSRKMDEYDVFHFAKQYQSNGVSIP
jgi:hypothetical protein